MFTKFGMFPVLAVIGMAVVPSVAGPTATSAPRPAICMTSFDGYSVPQSVARSCGDRILPLLRTTPLPGGGRAYDYGTYTWLEPPAHFNVLRASDKQLSEYGLPTRKQLGRNWRSVASRMRRFIAPSPYLVQIDHVRGFTCGITDSCGWDGHYVEGHTYTQVSATWTEPHFTAAGCSGDEFMQWAGLGGIYSVPASLGQTGTAFNVPGLAAHQGFIETIIDGSDSPPVAIDGFVPAAGDTVRASVLWDSSARQYSYLLTDTTAGSSSGAILSRTDTDPDNTTAEVISERPYVDVDTGQLSQLSDFQSVAVKDATSYWPGGSAGFVNNPHHYSIQMFDKSGNPLATTTNLDSDSDFTNTWVAC